MTAPHNLKIGFIGLGDQGGPMARAIADAGYDLHAWARRQVSLSVLDKTPFTQHESAASLARDCDVIALCLTDDSDIWHLLNEQGMAKALRVGSIVVNHGTGDPNENVRIAKALEMQNVRFLDAPVSGGRPGALTRTLTTLVGGDPDTFTTCEPIFGSFSRKVVRMGEVGDGQMTKLLNNALTMTNLKNAVDAFAIAGQLGFDIAVLRDVIVVSSGSSAILEAIGSQIDAEAARHLQVLMRKDIEHFAEAVRSRHLDPSALRERGLAGADGVVALAEAVERRH